MSLTLSPSSFPNDDAHFALPGPAGLLEVRTCNTTAPHIPVAGIICHPHPLFGGTMENKVVTTLSRTFKGMGIPNIRFNYRGVGQSEGKFDQGIGESEDLLAVIKWVKAVYPTHQIWLAGFSFGAYISLRIAHQIASHLVISIAPAVNHFDTKEIIPPSCPWIVVQGDQDEIVPATEVYSWVNSLSPAPQVLTFPSASHFFHGQLVDLRQRLETALTPYVINL